jgi:ribonuclease T2
MAKKFFTFALLIVLSCSMIVTGCAKHKKQPTSPSDASAGDFDYFLFTLSWAPEFCATSPKPKSNAECEPEKHMGLVVLGLWPQYDNGKSPEDCATTSPVSSSIVNHMMPIMPGKDLIQQGWSKHGTCSALSTQDYFGAIEKLYNGLSIPDDFKKPSHRAQTFASKIEKEFAAANNAPVRAFRVSCPQNQFSAMEICISKDMQYQACPSTVKDCRAPKIEVRPTQ